MNRSSSKRWLVFPRQSEQIRKLVSALGLSPITAQVLINRGLGEVEVARRFLTHDPSLLHDPFLMRDMDRAVERLAEAIRRKEHVLIYGDYDVDGITAGAFLARLLGSLGVETSYYVPHRVDEGYGLHRAGIDAAVELGATLLLTVDCGISSPEEVAYAHEKGLDVIITDHHEPGPELPPAVAVLNPKRPDCPYPFRDLAGVGVAFKLASALGSRVGFQFHHLARAFLDLVALGTICDVVPLLDENRFFAREGLRRLADTKKVGLRALLDKTRLTGRPLDSHDVGFILGPRLNASGRLGTARDAFELLTTADRARAEELAQELHHLNYERQQEEGRTLEEARAIVEETVDLTREKALILGSPEWHIGVIGIVASRLVEQYHRPTILLAVSEEEARGSGRSIRSFHLYEALVQCRDILRRCGGHEHAAGLSLDPGRIEEFRERFQAVADERLSLSDLRPTLEIDAVLKPPAITPALIEELAGLEPFGQANPQPLFAVREVTIQSVRGLGEKDQHLALRVGEGGYSFRGVGWRLGEWLGHLHAGDRVALCFALEMNEWQGLREMQLVIKDIKPRGAGA